MKNEEMTVIDHLDEIRKRLFICIVFFIIFSIAAYVYSDLIVNLLKKPIGETALIFTTPVEGFITKLKVAAFGGILGSSPVIFLESILFVSPALYRGEKILLFCLLPFIIALFLGGSFFSFWILLPSTIKFLLSFGSEFMQPMLSAGKYFSFVIWFVLGIGVVFELPIVLLMLSKLGIINYKYLSKKRKYILFMIVVTAALITPTPDAVTLLMVALPLMLLFEISLWIMFIQNKFFRRKAQYRE
ncbi:hypothetical protein Q428_14115 [Fervidicella metallireducens AeB]|uniref:Sec-independent protein translocase protein TatC n=1 Tax=Fervidicella metallireducens AeB TaxID=1403537 RepID=A0A017RS37_9CLOT|nr:twin-arginine translocase subunit TatC [Fervidicella metallireducens]EYE87284.1 hypothetical protein Q428_14115 [Fervidicella metallireducens AeB]